MLRAEQSPVGILEMEEIGYGTQPAACSVGTGAFSLEHRGRCVKLITHLPPNAEVKGEWSCIYTPPTCLHGAESKEFTFCIKVKIICHILKPSFGIIHSSCPMKRRFN